MLRHLFATTLAIALSAMPAMAQTSTASPAFPVKPVRIIVPLDPAVPVMAAGAPRTGTRRARFGDMVVDAPVLDRRRLAAGSEISGPAIIEEAMSTLLIPPGVRAAVEASGNIVIRLAQPALPAARHKEAVQ